MLKRLRVKFICINMGIVVSMLAVIFSLVIGSTRRNLQQESLSVLQAAAGDSDLHRPWQFLERGREEDGSLRHPEPRQVFLPYILVLLDRNGEIDRYEGYPQDAEAPADAADSPEGLRPLVDAALAEREPVGILTELHLRYLRTETPMGVKLVFLDMSNETHTLRSLVRNCLIIGVASLVVFFFLSMLLARWAVKPVEEAWTRQKQFVSDASHELKTPLTVIMTNAELLQGPEYDAGAKGRFAQNILTMSRQMRGLVESLLELARVDNGAVEAAAEELDLGRLCEEAVLPLEPLCFEKGLRIRSALAPGVRVRGNALYLRQVVEILLDNAQKYAHAPSEISLTLTQSGRSCRLRVTNLGDAISEKDLARLFERFYRADSSRSRDGSYGLGLSIAQKIVESHHGKIWAESAEGKNSFFVTLPTLAGGEARPS